MEGEVGGVVVLFGIEVGLVDDGGVFGAAHCLLSRAYFFGVGVFGGEEGGGGWWGFGGLEESFLEAFHEEGLGVLEGGRASLLGDLVREDVLELRGVGVELGAVEPRFLVLILSVRVKLRLRG